MPLSQFPTIPKPTKLPKLATANSRVYFDCNVTPIPRKYRPWLGWKQATPDSQLETIPGVKGPDAKGNYPFVAMADHEMYARAAGLTPTMQIYNQTANQATMWSTHGVPDVLPFAVGGGNVYQYIQANGNSGSDYMQAGNQAAQDAQKAKLYDSLKALARLTHDNETQAPHAPKVTYYGGLPTDQYMPIIFDFESSKTFNGDGTRIGTWLGAAEWLLRAKRWTKMLKEVRNIIGYSRQLYVYQYNGLALAYYQFADDASVNKTQIWMDIVAEEQAICRMLSGFCPSCGYLSDVEIRNPNFWFQNVINCDREIDEHYPQWRQSKIMYLNPFYQPSTTANPYHGKLMTMTMWETQIQFLVARGWSMLLWIGDMSRVQGYDFSAVQAYIDYLARYQK